MLGGGGSILAVPVLVYLLGQDPHAATTGALVLVGATALAGLAVHARAGRVRVGPGLAFGLAGVPGAVLGGRLSAAVDAGVLLAGLAAVLLVAAVAMLVRWWRARPQPAGTAMPVPVRRSPILVAAAATGVGLLTGFLGVGGGFLIVPALVLILAMSMPEATGTSLLVITITSGAALATRLGQHSVVDWPILAAFAATAIVAAVFGGRLTARIRPERLTVAFATLLLTVAVYAGARSLPALV